MGGRLVVTAAWLTAIVAALAFAPWAGGFETQAPDASAQEREISVEPFVWRFSEDYPGSVPDSQTPVDVVYIKTHDGASWMSRYDKSVNAVSGPASIRRLIEGYRAEGVRTIAWFVPKGNNYELQLKYAKGVLDAGVDALYADIEPYQGFCDEDCAALAENFWKPLKAARPDAVLGVIYDPRPQHWDTSGIHGWMSVADVALPMCYWETFGRAPWNDPAGCIKQAAADLPSLTGNRNVEYVPIVQGDTSPDKMKVGIAALKSVGSERMSIWRRGQVAAPLWAAIDEATRGSEITQVAEDMPQSRILAEIEALRSKDPRSLRESLVLLKLIERAGELDLTIT